MTTRRLRPRSLLSPPPASGVGLHPEQLVEIARAVAEAEPYWRPLVRHDPVARWFLRLGATARVETWLLGWTQGQRTELHDHGGSAGAVYVVDGTLTEDSIDEAGEPLQSLPWQAGSAHCFGAGHVHALRNLAPEAATSIHVYSPPLSSMTYYRRERAGLLIPARTEACDAPFSLAAGALG
jgi:hypothetical protein